MSETTPQLEQRNEQMEAERTALIAQMRELDGEAPLSAASEQPAPQSETQASDTSGSEAGTEGTVVELKEGEPPVEAEAAGDSKEAKEVARKDKSWKQLDAEKAEVRAARAEVDKARAEAERLKVEAAEKAATAGQYKPEDYLAAAKRWEAEGETELAAQARSKANALKTEIEAAKQNSQRERYKVEWQDAIRQAKSDRPELADPEHELTKEVNEVFKNRPVFTTYPGGVADAVRVADLKLQAGRADVIQAERDKLQARLDELEKNAQPGGATTSAPETGVKEFKELSLTEQHAKLLRAAKDADRQGDASLLFG